MTTSSFSLFSGWWLAGFLGANHASVLYSGNRGAVAYENTVAAADETSFGWIEYGNPHSTMGNGDLMDHKVDFVIEGKSVFDWMDHDDAIVETVAYTADGAPACVGATPCGPYYIYPTDLGSYPSGAKSDAAKAAKTINKTITNPMSANLLRTKRRHASR